MMSPFPAICPLLEYSPLLQPARKYPFMLLTTTSMWWVPSMQSWKLTLALCFWSHCILYRLRSNLQMRLVCLICLPQNFCSCETMKCLCCTSLFIISPRSSLSVRIKLSMPVCNFSAAYWQQRCMSLGNLSIQLLDCVLLPSIFLICSNCLLSCVQRIFFSFERSFTFYQNFKAFCFSHYNYLCTLSVFNLIFVSYSSLMSIYSLILSLNVCCLCIYCFNSSIQRLLQSVVSYSQFMSLSICASCSVFFYFQAANVALNCLIKSYFCCSFAFHSTSTLYSV